MDPAPYSRQTAPIKQILVDMGLQSVKEITYPKVTIWTIIVMEYFACYFTCEVYF